VQLAVNPGQLARKLASLNAIVNLLDDLGVDVPGFYPFTAECTKALVRACARGSRPLLLLSRAGKG